MRARLPVRMQAAYRTSGLPSSQCQSAKRALLIRTRAAPPKYNPQNVDDPIVRPSASFSPVESVRAQLDACSKNDDPWMNHGLQTMYEFAEDAGGMERSYYFVQFQKDLYHFDHFMGGFATQLGPLIDNSGYQVLEERVDCPKPGCVQVDVRVTSRTQEDAGVFTFTLVQRELGKKKGCWMTKSLGRKTQ